MKKIFATILLFTFTSLFAQHAVIPGDTIFETKYIQPERYQMKWYIVQEGNKHEVARINTSIQPGKYKIAIVNDIDVNNAKTTWIDSTITLRSNLSPIRHYSDNLERAVKLKFGASVTGSYNDKIQKKEVKVNEEVAAGKYFDSNFFPYLVRLLPYKDGYTKEITTYDYHPAKKGIVIQKIMDVKSGTYRNKNGLNLVWIVTTMETIKGITSQVKYYIDKSDRKIFKQEIFDGQLNTLIERSE
ncbi:hypothetical protein [Flavobacterium suzhouense]|uniref:DUF3108 domain-containing protein n=1 Tax=Flavobacterium suzhouense TaxID=1529638 RepID=A0ABW5NTL4_9FLAO